MKTIVSLLLVCCSFTWATAQSTYTSIKQAKYVHGEEELQYVSGSFYHIELSFHIKEGYILLRNRDLKFEDKYINVIPLKTPNTWRAYSNSNKKSCLFSIITNNGQKCISLDDGSIVYLLMVHSTESNSK